MLCLISNHRVRKTIHEENELKLTAAYESKAQQYTEKRHMLMQLCIATMHNAHTGKGKEKRIKTFTSYRLAAAA